MNRVNQTVVGAYWGCRRESSSSCAQRLLRCLLELGTIDPVLGSWFLRGESRTSANTPVALSAADLEVLFERGSNRNDVDGGVIDELGFSVGLWNRARPAIGLSAHAGSFSKVPGLLNSFVLNVAGPDDGADALYERKLATAVFEAIIRAWEPHWATWRTYEWAVAQSPAPREPVVGWLTYLSTPVSLVAADASARAFEGGTVLTLGSDIEAVSDAMVINARTELVKQKALTPIPLC